MEVMLPAFRQAFRNLAPSLSPVLLLILFLMLVLLFPALPVWITVLLTAVCVVAMLYVFGLTYSEAVNLVGKQQSSAGKFIPLEPLPPRAAPLEEQDGP